MCQCHCGGSEVQADRYRMLIGHLAEIRMMLRDNFNREETFMATANERLQALAASIGDVKSQVDKVGSEVSRLREAFDALAVEARENTVSEDTIQAVEGALNDVVAALHAVDDINPDAVADEPVHEGDLVDTDRFAASSTEAPESATDATEA